jgi:hypothetical protein
VLGDDGDDMRAAVAERLNGAFDREVVGFSRAAGEADLLCGGADERRDLAARAVHGGLGVPPELVLPAGGIAEALGEVRQHRLEHAGIDGGGGVVVEVDGFIGVHACGFLVNARGEAAASGVGASSSVATSCSEQVDSAETIRSLMRQSGSRMLHFAY